MIITLSIITFFGESVKFIMKFGKLPVYQEFLY